VIDFKKCTGENMTLNAQYINSNVYFVKYSDMFRCIDINLRESLVIYAKVTQSVKFKCLHK